MEWQRHSIKKAGSDRGLCKLMPADVWAHNVLKYNDLEPTPELVSLAVEKFSALYEYELASLRLVQNPNFNIARNISDHVDGQQVGYLSDPQTVFITKDSDFRIRVRNSPQAQRIKTFDELLERALKNQALA